MGQRLRTTCVTKAYITVLRYPKVLLGQDLNKFFCASYCIQTSLTHTQRVKIFCVAGHIQVFILVLLISAKICCWLCFYVVHHLTQQ